MIASSKLILLGTLFTVGYCATMAEFGEYLSSFNLGACKAFMDDPSNTVSDCYVACTNTGTEIINSFDETTYTDGIFTTSEFTSKAAVAAIKYMSQMSKCRQVEFLQSLDNRFSDPGFASGMAVNFILQAFKKDNSQLYTSLDQIKTAWNDDTMDSATRWETIGQYAQAFLTKSFAYSAPDRAASRRTY